MLSRGLPYLHGVAIMDRPLGRGLFMGWHPLCLCAWALDFDTKPMPRELCRPQYGPTQSGGASQSPYMMSRGVPYLHGVVIMCGHHGPSSSLEAVDFSCGGTPSVCQALDFDTKPMPWELWRPQYGLTWSGGASQSPYMLSRGLPYLHGVKVIKLPYGSFGFGLRLLIVASVSHQALGERPSPLQERWTQAGIPAQAGPAKRLLADSCDVSSLGRQEWTACANPASSARRRLRTYAVSVSMHRPTRLSAATPPSPQTSPRPTRRRPRRSLIQKRCLHQASRAVLARRRRFGFSPVPSLVESSVFTSSSPLGARRAAVSFNGRGSRPPSLCSSTSFALLAPAGDDLPRFRRLERLSSRRPRRWALGGWSSPLREAEAGLLPSRCLPPPAATAIETQANSSPTSCRLREYRRGQ
ncbi:hypothetical protein THAOC_04146 [Thalassiosira oceanica]|uniref:Uncharacterized protein n=1 Tax=Thalassiosira oceanica TaxID=159749 RepID=K0TAU5_THAOC|nr:hypothetical protein THAOC_04146 [Thalassiosira oceanica]|eukprot:EJK74189.1 hypothetical protein THAOC_04146 [Thalassiosira oceanica]